MANRWGAAPGRAKGVWVPRYDLEGDALVDYRSAVAPPADLDDFWGRTIADARTASWPPKVEPINCGLRVIDVFDVTFSGFGGEPIKAWYHRPAGDDDDLPVVVRAPGYGGGRGLAHQVSQWPLAGYASLSIDARGQGSGWGWTGDTPTQVVSARPVPAFWPTASSTPKPTIFAGFIPMPS